MKVYVVKMCYPYEGESIYKVMSNLEEAKAFVEKQQTIGKWDQFDNCWTIKTKNNYDSWEIEEFELEGGDND